MADTTVRDQLAAERSDDTTEEITMTTPEPVDPIPADDAPHAYVAVRRTHSPNADRPEWQWDAGVIPVHDRAEIDLHRRRGYELIPIGPDGDTGTRAITKPAPRMVEGGLYRNPLGAEIRLIALQRQPFAPGLWLAHTELSREFVTAEGLAACGYTLVTEEATDGE
ncbi:hypothetical protein [Nocardia cyriacigeorgica]|uniref:hypothetical protein n=1 Tax=Nocardia cyriacigeorgica TaxID=135487 RepID=UPI002453911E|nr:hypothetical protein [Nocardia cyriacigeorgica]